MEQTQRALFQMIRNVDAKRSEREKFVQARSRGQMWRGIGRETKSFRGHRQRLFNSSSESTSVGVAGIIDGVVGRFDDSGGVPAIDCSKQSESGGVCFGPVSSCNRRSSRRD
jgi:hypothetical protein